MANDRSQIDVIGELAPVRTGVAVAVVAGLFLLVLYLSTVVGFWSDIGHGFDRTSRGFLILLPNTLIMVIFGVPTFYSLLFRRGRHLFVQGGNLILGHPLFRSIPIGDIDSVTLGAEIVFEGQPSSFVVRVRGRRKYRFTTVFYRNTVDELVARLAAHGIEVSPRPAPR